MNCSEARQFIVAFLDNELDAALSLEVQQHIEHCPLCARECEIENAVRRQLVTRLQQADVVPEFDEAALLRVLRSEAGVRLNTPRILRRYWKLGAAGGVVTALLIAALLLVTNSVRQTHGESLADALVDDFDHFVTESKPLHIVSTDAVEVSEWLRDRTALVVRVPVVAPEIGALMGGRKCKINGTPAAFVVYRMGSELASVVALRASEEALSRMKRVDRNGHTHWIARCRGHTVLVCRRGELIYAVVSRLTEESLSPLMPPVEG